MNMQYTINQIKEILGAQLKGAENATITNVSIDSRSISVGAGTLFVAIVGQRHDGHEYINNLYQKRGVRIFLVSTPINQSNYPDASFLIVHDTLKAFQQLAAYHRSQFGYPVIGITGSNGKTIVKEWLSQLLAPSFRVIRSPKSYNSQVGVPISVLSMTDDFDLAIFEAGISHPGEMDHLESIIAPTIGVFTSLGPAHGENFSSNHAKAQEKMKLFARSGVIVYCRDYEEVDRVAQKYCNETGVEFLSWSRTQAAWVEVREVTQSARGTLIRAAHSSGHLEFTIPFTDEASVQNAITCLCVLLHLKIGRHAIISGMEKLTPVAMRLELKEGINGCTLINDTYNSDLGSLPIALDFLAQQSQHPKRIVIISDIHQSGYPPQRLYSEVARLMQQKGVTQIIGIGPTIAHYSHLFTTPSKFYPNSDIFLSELRREEFSNSSILLKGSRVFEFERISAVLEQKTHRTVLEVNLNALVHNLNYFRGLLSPGVRVMVMVKAFSYGIGAHEVASVLQYHNVDYLGVAFADEGVALRQAGITLPIGVLNPAHGSYELMLKHRLEPMIYSFSSLDSFHAAARRMGVHDYPVHIKIDTGMHRLGFSPSHTEALCQRLRGMDCIRVQSILSHLVGTDSMQHDDFTRQQVAIFASTSKAIASQLGYSPILHILNSGGIERFPQAQFDMVRLGIGLYGVSAVHQSHLQTVSTLKTFIAQLHSVPAGDTIGYNRKGVVHRPSTIATIPIGYADGLNRRLSNGVGGVLVNGQLAPIIGNICMDLSMVDVTGIDASEGDEVVIFGEKPTILEMAEAMGTIPYEVLTSISRRVKRVYYRE